MSPLEAARTQLGIAELPGNKGIPFERYALAGEEPGPWCARLVRWCYTEAGLRLPGNRYLIGRVATMQDELRLRGAILTREVEPEPGDLVFLRDRGASDTGPGHHVAMLDRVVGSKLHTIDGNWGDRCQPVERERGSSSILCIARWPIRAVA